MVINGGKSTLVTASMIDSVTFTTGTILNQGNMTNGYEITFRHENISCNNSLVKVLLKDTIPWTRINYQWLGNGTSACWWFDDSNLLTYNESLGDKVSKCHLTWEVPEYQSHTKISACDNDANNFMRFNQSEYKSFFVYRRRNSMSSLAGIFHSRSCSSANGITVIRNIFIQ